jgi:DNA-binding transcriptional ArsR family regulator
MSHPLRARILKELAGERLSPRMLATRLEQPLANVSYHVRQLASLGLIELVGVAKRRGASEHFYLARALPADDTQCGPALDDESAIEAFGQRLQTATESLTAEGSGEALLEHITIAVDPTGSRELQRAMAGLVTVLQGIEDRSAGDQAHAQQASELIEVGVLLTRRPAGRADSSRT